VSEIERVLKNVNRVTGLELTPKDFELILSLQDDCQNRQYRDDLRLAIAIHDDAEQHGGRVTVEANQRYEEVSKRIGLWSTWADLAKPRRTGLFIKRIPPTNRMILRGLLSPNCKLVKSGGLN